MRRCWASVDCSVAPHRCVVMAWPTGSRPLHLTSDFRLCLKYLNFCMICVQIHSLWRWLWEVASGHGWLVTGMVCPYGCPQGCPPDCPYDCPLDGGMSFLHAGLWQNSGLLRCMLHWKQLDWCLAAYAGESVLWGLMWDRAVPMSVPMSVWDRMVHRTVHLTDAQRSWKWAHKSFTHIDISHLYRYLIFLSFRLN